MLRTSICCIVLFTVSTRSELWHKAAFSADSGPSDNLLKLFHRIDELGQFKDEPLTLVELALSVADQPDRRWSEKVWLVRQDNLSISIRKGDLIPWTYSKASSTTVPSSWHPQLVKIEAVKEIDLKAFFKEQSIPEKKDDDGRPRRKLSELSGPSHRLMLAFLAWKHGLPEYCQPIIEAAPDTSEIGSDFDRYREMVLTDLAWLHYLRAVNLLMYADRREVLPHLRLAITLSPESEYSIQAKDLLNRLEQMLANRAEAPKSLPDENSLNEEERARRYISQLMDLNCPQFSQPGFIEPYVTVIDGRPDENPPSAKLNRMGMKAVPFLIEALDDDTPTRTVYHWRDFAHSRLVWRVSDFAWHILRDVTKKEFGYQRVVGFTLGAMKPEQKKAAIADIKKWYGENKDRSEDDQMFSFFSSRDPEDWITAGEYFLKQNNNRAVKPLIEHIPQARDFSKGDLCELVGKFRDRSAEDVLKKVMISAKEDSDRLGAAIGLWNLGNRSGIPVVIDYVKAADQPYGSWDTPIWFLMRTRSKEGIEALQAVILRGSAERASEVLDFVTMSISGDLRSQRRDPAGCAEIAPVLVAAMSRSDYTGGSYNDIKIRIKDEAARAFVLLRDGTDDPFPGGWPTVDPKHFDMSASQENVRDRQIETLKDWFVRNGGKLNWDEGKRRLILKEVEPK